MKDYSLYEIKALHELAGYRYIFYECLQQSEVKDREVKDRKVKAANTSLQKSIETFTEIFCQNNFADADYTIIQDGPRGFKTTEEWINQNNINTVLKCLTYIIWTDKSINGYFIRSIKSRLIDKHLTRLENILTEYDMQLKDTNVPVVFMGKPEDKQPQMMNGH